MFDTYICNMISFRLEHVRIVYLAYHNSVWQKEKYAVYDMLLCKRMLHINIKCKLFPCSITDRKRAEKIDWFLPLILKNILKKSIYLFFIHVQIIINLYSVINMYFVARIITKYC